MSGHWYSLRDRGLVASAALLVAACAKATTPGPHASPPPAPAQQEARAEAELDPAAAAGVDLVTAWLDAAAARDKDALVALYAPEATATPASSGMVITGGANIVDNFYQPFWDAFPDLTSDVLAVLVHGDRVAVISRARGTHSRPMMGMPASNRQASFVGLQLLQLDGGKIATEYLYADNLNFMAQLGMSDGPHRPVDADPAPDTTVAAAAGTQAEADNVALVERALALFNAHDAGALAAVYAGDAVVRDQSAPADVTGKDAIERDLDRYFRWFPDAHIEVQALWAAGDHVVATYVLTGTHRGDIESLDIAATDRTIELEGADVYRVTGGKIAEHWRFLDGMAMLMQLGVLRAPGT